VILFGAGRQIFMDENNPMSSPDQWEADVERRYPSAKRSTQANPEYRNYQAEVRPTVREFYRLNHQYQTFDFVKQKRTQFLPLQRQRMSVWEAMEFLNTLVDDSDPDTELSQIEHLLQAAEAIRADGHPRWFILVGLIHDLGKILCLFGEPQWAVVGDTFPVGCAYSSTIVYHEFFRMNADWGHAVYSTECGIYERHAGLENIMMSWGHDEYLYHVTKAYLPIEAQYMIRYHSFYPGHRENAYTHLFSEQDQQLFEWVRKFNPYDLYSKSDERPDVESLRPFYMDLIDEFFPSELAW
jgi:inositol oxygenase